MTAPLAILSSVLCLAGCAAPSESDDKELDEKAPVDVASSALIAAPICELIADFGNDPTQNAQLLAQFNQNIAGRSIDLPTIALPIGRRFILNSVMSLALNGCDTRLRINTTLKRVRPLHDGQGAFDVKGTLYAAKQRVFWQNRPDLPPVEAQLICLRNPKIENVKLSNLSNVGEQAIDVLADDFVKNQCFPAGSTWQQVETGIAIEQTLLDPSFPSLDYEWLSDTSRPCDSTCPTLKDDQPHGVISNYGAFGTQVATALHETGSDFEFELASNNDLFAIKKRGTGTGTTEVHVLSAASNYQQFVLQTGTALHETGDNVEFGLLPNRDLVVLIKSGTGTGTTEVHVLSAASNYQEFTLHTGTALHETGSNVELEVAPNGDLFAIIKNGTGTSTTEVHVLSAASNYQEFTLHTGTALHETDDSFNFVLMGNGDVAAIKRANTGSDMTEVHMLDASNGYQSFKLQVPTALNQGGVREFLSATNRDIVAIVKSGGSSGMTQLHRLLH